MVFLIMWWFNKVIWATPKFLAFLDPLGYLEVKLHSFYICIFNLLMLMLTTEDRGLWCKGKLQFSLDLQARLTVLVDKILEGVAHTKDCLTPCVNTWSVSGCQWPLGWKLKIQIKFLQWFSVSWHQDKKCQSRIYRTYLAFSSTGNDLRPLCLTPDILFSCLDTENHRKSLIWSLIFHPSVHLLIRYSLVGTRLTE